jgi:nicotinamidase-related amidase
MPLPALDLSRTAVLSMDFQPSIAGMLPEVSSVLPRVASVLTAARAAGTAVIHVAVGFRPGKPEISPRNQGFAAVKAGGIDLGLPQPVPAVAAIGDEPVVVKHRVGAFQGTDMDMLLRARDIHTLVLMGVTTSGVVLSTVRYAADADFRIIVVEDCCIDRETAVHRCLIDSVFPRQAQIAASADVIAALSAKPA